MTPRLNLTILASFSQPSSSKCIFRPICKIPVRPTRSTSTRLFATHSDRPFPRPDSAPGSSSSSSSTTAPTAEEILRRLEADARSRGRTGFEGQETVGPFPLGVGPSGRSKGWRKWGELGIGGKLMRAGRQTGNLSVILVGGTLFVILAIALSTELFAKNSPSVLYSQAVDLIRESDALNPHLLPPLSFTHTPHSSAPIRGSPPLPTRHILHPRSGREHLLLTFWVHGRGIGEEPTLGFVRRWYENILVWGRQAGEWAGMVQPADHEEVGRDTIRKDQVAVVHQKRDTADEGSGWLTGLFGGLKGGQPSQKGSQNKRGLPPPGTYKVGEVYGDYVKNAAGQYQLLSLVIDVPASQVGYPTRAVVFWSPEADSEGLLGKRR